MTKEITACTMDCPDACSLIVEKSGDKIRIRGNPYHPVTAGFTCAKIKRLPGRLTSPHRITTPRIRKNGRWNPIRWDDALDLCAAHLNKLRPEPSSVFHCQGEGAKGVLKQANKLFFAKYGATRVKGSLCDAAGFIAGLIDFGSRKNNDIEDLLNTRTIVNWGRNFLKCSVHTAALIRKARKKGAKLLTISPGGEKYAEDSDHAICIRPGTDRFLAAAVIKKLMESGRIAPEIISRTRHWDHFRLLLDALSEKELAAACLVSPADIETVLSYYMDSRPAATFIGTGLQRYLYGGENVRFIDALALCSGNVGQSGGGVHYHLHSLGNFNVEWAAPPETKSRRAFPIADIAKSISEARNPAVEMIWVNGSNLLNQAPDTKAAIATFKQVPFKVVVDAFMTDTADHADLFLPAALMLEQEDLVGSYLHHYIHYAGAVTAPPGEARTDYWILSELGKRLDPPILLPGPETCFRESLKSEVLNISWGEIKDRRFAKAVRPPIAYHQLQFDHGDGKYRLPENLSPEPEPPGDFPLRLLSLVRGDAIHSQILPEDQIIPVEVLISPECPALRHLDVSRRIWLVSAIGKLECRLKWKAGLQPDTVIVRRGTWMKCGGGLNQIISAQLTDIGMGAAYYAQYVRLENQPGSETAFTCSDRPESGFPLPDEHLKEKFD